MDAITTTHTDPTRPEFGFEAPQSDFFIRSLEAVRKAERNRDYDARALADRVVAGLEHDYDVRRYRRAIAGQQHAEAIYEVEAAKVRAA